MMVEDFLPKESVPITMSIIFICSLATFYSGILDKQTNPESNFVDYDVAVIVCPTLLIGAKLGSILNKITAKVIIVVITTWFTKELITKVYNNACKQKEQESEHSVKMNLVCYNLP
jgi:uncharacterized membrane protein YfcA